MTLVGAIVRYATVLVLTFSLGLHWALLQTVAWTGMIASYSQKSSLTEAISRTFDGLHPCKLCKVVEQGRAAEKESEQQKHKSGSKLDFGILSEPLVFHLSADRERIPSNERFGFQRGEEPPKPRPRLFVDNLV
jgi:hypothetical protein